MSLCRTRWVPDTIYRAAVAAIGEQGVVELVGVLGYYTLISMTLNAFAIRA
jgi:4-carboxymuconolactone decarboxylase